MKIYNTLSRRSEEFKPLKAGKVGMYVCGITAYDSCHMGHARGAVAFDIIVRYLRYKGLKVKFAKNHTDIDDKIINRANKENRDWKGLAEYYIKEYNEDMASLGNLKPDLEPRATEHIKEMIATISKLFDKGLAYQTKSGVYFSVRKFEGYGRLSGKNIEELEAGARVSVDEEKSDPLDFALWKASKPGEPKWPSPWGDGRPGWHIECSAMSSKYLGQPFDIHGGGEDLIFPHHENEIAQAEGAEGKPFVKYWLHNGFININSEKMSKSLGNFMTVREVLKRHDFEAVRYFLASSHYRSPIDYTDTAILEAQSAVDRFYEMTARLPMQETGSMKHDTKQMSSPPPIKTLGGKLQRGYSDIPEIPAFLPAGRHGAGMTAVEKELSAAIDSAKGRIEVFMDDDFNSAGAFGVIFELVRFTNKYLDSIAGGQSPSEKGTVPFLSSKWHDLRTTFNSIFGVFGSDPAEYHARRKKIGTAAKGVDVAKVEKLIVDRSAARKAKDFAKADMLKKQLLDMGIEFKDKPDGTTEWKMK